MNLDVRINRLIPGDGNVRAVATANFDGCFAVKNIKVMEGSKGLFVSMPSYKAQDSSYKDICFPTTPEFRQQLSNEIIDAYHQTISQLQEQKNIPVCAEPDEQSASMGMAM